MYIVWLTLTVLIVVLKNKKSINCDVHWNNFAECTLLSGRPLLSLCIHNQLQSKQSFTIRPNFSSVCQTCLSINIVAINRVVEDMVCGVSTFALELYVRNANVHIIVLYMSLIPFH